MRKKSRKQCVWLTVRILRWCEREYTVVSVWIYCITGLDLSYHQCGYIVAPSWIYRCGKSGLSLCQRENIITSTVIHYCALYVLSQYIPPRAVIAFTAILWQFMRNPRTHNISAGPFFVRLSLLIFCLLSFDFVLYMSPLHLCCCVLCRFSWFCYSYSAFPSRSVSLSFIFLISSFHASSVRWSGMCSLSHSSSHCTNIRFCSADSFMKSNTFASSS